MGELRKMLKRLHYPVSVKWDQLQLQEVMLVCARWYAAYLLILRHIEEMMKERGVFVDHATVHPLGIEDPAGPGPCLSQTQAAGGLQLAD